MKRSRNKILISVGILVLIALVIAGLELSNTTHFFHKASTANQLRGDINYGPPTKADKQDSESRKSTPPSNDTSSNTSTSNTSSKKSVDVEITTWNQNETVVSVNGYASNIVENDGTCTLTLKSETSTNTVTKQRPAEANVTNTSCGEISIPNSSLTTGRWTAVLSYSSSTSTGASDPLEIEVK